MNLGFDAKRLFLNHAGLGNYSRWLVQGLIDSFPENQYHLYTTVLSDFKKEFEADNTHLHLPPNLFKSFWRTKGIKKDLLKDKIDVYHGLSNELPMGIEKTTIKTLVTIHDLIFKIHPEYYNGIDRKIYDIKFKSACQRADRIVAISRHTKQTIVDHYGIPEEKIDVIYIDAPAIFHKIPKQNDIENIKKKYALNKPFFLNVGAIGGRKNQFRLLQAFADVASAIDQDLILTGKPGKETDAFLFEVNKLGLTERVRFLPGTSEEDLFHIYHASFATVFPSIYEGFGIPLVESMRCGKPVLTSYGSSLEEVAGAAGLLCDPLNTSDISIQLLRLADKEVYNVLKKAIPEELVRFDPIHSFSKYMALYRLLRP